MPSKDELTELNLQKDVVGGFSDSSYWSSTKMVNSFGNVEVWIQIFGDDDIAYYYSEDTTSYVRAVRAF